MANIQHNQKYDYMIAGAGCAGLSLLMRMLQEPFFADKLILVIEEQQEHKAKKNWCFWENQPGIFEPLVLHSWKKIDFYSPAFSQRFDIHPYTYKMIRSKHLDQYVRLMATPFKNIHWLNEKVESIGNENGKAFALAGGRQFQADYLFNSIMFQPPRLQPQTHYLQQHFKGWMIETDEAVFDPGVARLMDFRTTQKSGTAFVYVLPLTTTQALVEFTLFSPRTLTDEDYEAALRIYIRDELKLTKYQVIETENGVIPMTNHHFPKQEGAIIHIGTAGGDTKPSTGYTFQFIQKRTAAIVANLIAGKASEIPAAWAHKRFSLYDSTLLRVLAHQKMAGDALFARLFSRNTPQYLFRFLDNDTNLLEEFPIMASMPATIFLPALLKEVR